MTEFYCETKQRQCPAMQFGILLATDPASFELRDVTSLDVETLTPCASCPFKTMGRAALTFKNLAASGRLGEILGNPEQQ